MNKKEWLKSRTQKGLCYNCSNQSIPNKTLCESCNSKNNENSRNRTRQRKTKSLCTRCGQQTTHDKTFCDKCLSEDKLNRLERLSRNICSYCKTNEVVPDKTYCKSCAYKRKIEREEKKVNGLCCGSGCNNLTFCKTSRCIECISKLKQRHAELRKTIISHYGLKCNCQCGCNVTNIKHLTIDHINNDGAEHRRTIGTGGRYYKWIIKNNFPNYLQILCWNCNCAKQYFGGCV